MKKTILLLAVFGALIAGNTGISWQFGGHMQRDTIPEGGMKPDSIVQVVDTIISEVNAMVDSLLKGNDTLASAENKLEEEAKEAPAKPTWDKRWFISPMLKVQAVDFGMHEKNRSQVLSGAHQLSFRDKSVLSASASAYKNLSGRLSFSIDIGIGHGHVTNDTVMVENTEARMYNTGAAAFYLHLLKPQFKLQPYVMAGINSMVGGASYMSAPLGMGFKYSGTKIMVHAQAAYGMAMRENISNTMMYTAGIYIPLKNKKAEEKEKKKKEDKEKEKDDKKKDSGANGKNGGVTTINITNNYYYGAPPDSSRKKYQPEEDGPEAAERKKKKAEEWGDNGGWEDRDDIVSPKPYDPDDPMTFKNARKFVVYFEYDDYALTASAFREIDRVVGLLRQNPGMKVHLKGHTDLRGSGVYNTPLSKKRAQMVFDYMNSRGVPKERMVLSYYGKDKPITEKDDPSTAWLNRRTELVIYDPEN